MNRHFWASFTFVLLLIGVPQFSIALPASPVGTWQITFRISSVSPTYITFSDDNTVSGYTGPDPSVISGTWSYDARGRLVCQLLMVRNDGAGVSWNVTMITRIGRNGRMTGFARAANGMRGIIGGVRADSVTPADIAGTWHTTFSARHKTSSLSLSFSPIFERPGMYEITCEALPDLTGRAVVVSSGWVMFYVIGDVFPDLNVTMASAQGRINFRRMSAVLRGEIENGNGGRMRVRIHK